MDVALVSRAPVLEMRPRLYEARPERMKVDLLPLLQRVGVDFVAGDATAIDGKFALGRIECRDRDLARVVEANLTEAIARVSFLMTPAPVVFWFMFWAEYAASSRNPTGR